MKLFTITPFEEYNYIMTMIVTDNVKRLLLFMVAAMLLMSFITITLTSYPPENDSPLAKDVRRTEASLRGIR